MSTKKYNTIGMDSKTWQSIDDKAADTQRSRGFIIEEILRRYFAEKPEGVSHADK